MLRFFTNIFTRTANRVQAVEEIRHRPDERGAESASAQAALPAPAAREVVTEVTASTLARFSARSNAVDAVTPLPVGLPLLPPLNFESLPALSIDIQEDGTYPENASTQEELAGARAEEPESEREALRQILFSENYTFQALRATLAREKRVPVVVADIAPPSRPAALVISASTSTDRIEEIPPLRSPDSRNLAPAVPAEQRSQEPVFNQDGTLNHANMCSFVTSLMEQLPPLPDNAHARLAIRREQLVRRLAHIPALVADGILENSDRLLAIRDHFSAAARDARKLAKHFLGRRFPRHPDNQAALLYSCLAANLVELKRMHLTGAAPAVVESYVERERANLERVVPTLSYMTSSNVSKDAGLSASYEFGVANLELGGTRNRIIWFDDDRDVNFWNSYGFAVKAGGPGKWIFNTSLKMGLEAGGTYFETEKMAEMLQLIVNLDANRAFPARSADPGARARSHGLQRGLNAVLKNAAAQIYTEEPGAPLYLNDEKLAKGVNATKLHLLGAAFDHLAGTASLGALVRNAYPAAADRLRGEAGEGVFHEPLANAIPISDPVGRGPAPYRNYNYFSVNAGIGKKRTPTPGLAIGGEWSAGISGNTAQFHLQNPEAAHTLLDPNYHADMAGTLKLTTQLDALLDAAQPPKLHLYSQVRAALGHESAEPLPDIDRRYYGAEENISAQFRDSTTNPDATELRTRLNDIRLACNNLRAHYLDFVGNAAKLAARPDKYTPSNALDALHATRMAAFDAINRAVWGAGEYDAATGYPGGASAALKNPEKFLAQTHDALGLALGCAGIHLAVVKRRMMQLLANSPHAETREQAGAEMHATDQVYARARTLLDKTYLPMKKADVYLKEGTFEDIGLSQRHNLTIKTSANTLFKVNFGEMIAHGFGKTMGDYEVTNEAGQVALSAQCRYQYADNQINPSRQGNFLDFKFAAQGGHPLTGALMVKGVMHALQKLHPEVDLDLQRTTLIEQLQGLALDAVSGAGVVFRLRRFPDAGHKRFTFQFLRVFESKTAGPKIGIPILTPVGLFTAKWSKQVSLQNAVYEVLGPDIGYLMLQHKKLKQVLSLAAVNAGNLVAQGVDENQVLRAQFKGTVDRDPVLGAGFEGDRNARWVADSYFGSATLIPTVIDEYMAYVAAAVEAEANETSLEDVPAANEFYRFFERDTEAEPFHRVAEYAMEAKHHAPGASVNWTDKANELQGEAHDPFELPPSLLSRIPMPLLPSGRSWEEEKAHIRGLAFGDRIDYFCSPEGRPVLDVFVRIIDTTKAVHDISRHRVRDTRYGFWTRLKDPRERKQASGAGDNQARASQPNRSTGLRDQLETDMARLVSR